MSARKLILFTIVLALVFSVLLSGCGQKPDNNITIISPTQTTTTPANTGTTTSGVADRYQEIYAGFKALLPVDPPDNLKADGVKKGGEFDVNSVFTVLTHLSMEPGYVLDYIYLTNGAAGGPILYIRQAGAAPFSNYEAYRLATHATPRPDNDQSMIWLVKDEPDQKAGNKIKVDGTDEGYFDYALLQTFGNQFYLFGTARVNDKRLVGTGAELEKIFTEVKDAGLTPMDAQFLENARAIDLQPVVKTQENYMLVRFVTFTEWGGFIRVSYLIKHDYPHTIFSINTETLLAYESGAKL